MSKKWSIIGLGLWIVSSIAMGILAFVVFPVYKPMQIIMLYVFMLLHQLGNGFILYRFAVTKHRMSNKLHVYNKLMMIITVSAIILHIFAMNIISDGYLREESWVTVLIFGIIMLLNIIYQENNTSAFLKKVPFKIQNSNKRNFNQLFSLYTSELAIIILWVGMVTNQLLSPLTAAFLFLYVIQTSLSYTTYGQSKYWNVTYELLFVVYIIAYSIQSELLITFILGVAISAIIGFRITDSFNRISRFVGLVLHIGLVPLAYFVHLESVSQTNAMRLAIGGMAIIYLIVFIIDRPKFIKKLFVI